MTDLKIFISFAGFFTEFNGHRQYNAYLKIILSLEKLGQKREIKSYVKV